MGLLLDGNRGTYAERVTRVRGKCVRRPTDMNFPAVANTEILKLKRRNFWGLQNRQETKNELVWYLSAPNF